MDSVIFIVVICLFILLIMILIKTHYSTFAIVKNIGISKEENEYIPNIQYNYTAKNTNYMSTNIMSSYNIPSFKCKNKAIEFLKQLKFLNNGKNHYIKAYVFKSNPELSYIINDRSETLLKMFILIFSFGTVYGVYKYKNELKMAIGY